MGAGQVERNRLAISLRTRHRGRIVLNCRAGTSGLPSAETAHKTRLVREILETFPLTERVAAGGGVADLE